LLFYQEEVPVAGKYPIQPKRFFSAGADVPVRALALLAVKKVFPDNHRIHDLPDAQFQSGGELTAYDQLHRMTKINWLLRQSRVETAAH